MSTSAKGQVLVPTGGGKTMIMIRHALRMLADGPQTIVVVAPRILLANQLCEEFMEQISGTWTHVCHAHSGETRYFKSTKPEKIALFNDTARAAGESCIIFTTYHSLHKVIDSGIDISCAYFDEAHNSVARHFFIGTAATSIVANRCYFFTATPRISRRHDRSMNNSDIYGGILCNVPAPELINNGSIIPPQVIGIETNVDRTKDSAAQIDADTVSNIIDNLDDSQAAKVLVAAPSSRVLGRMLGQSDMIQQLKDRDYHVLHITSKFGAYVDDRKVNREQFFNTLTEWGADPSKKFVVFHYSILSEGINVPGLTHCVLLRNLNVVEMAQTIGRVIRIDRNDAADIASGKLAPGQCQFYRKSCGFVSVPIHNNYGAATIKRLQNVVDAIFVKGIPPLALV
jgi:superfamily II DNA or RNA helicase